MDELTLSKKYEPKTFFDFEINSDIIDVLKLLIKTNKLMLLFVGDCGSGKSTIINALINEYYDNKPIPEDNLLHINILKDQGINYYRTDVKYFCQTASDVKGKKKFVILDDIDYIPDQSQQIFRKYIDQYSHNVNFVASCLNKQQVIGALQSRFDILYVKPLQPQNIMQIVDKISTAENIKITPVAKEMLTKICMSSVKLAVNYLEKFSLLEYEITEDVIDKVCTNISFVDLNLYSSLVKSGKLADAIALIYTIYDQGYSTFDIVDAFFHYIKTTATIFTEAEKYDIIPLIIKYILVFHNIHEYEIQLALFTNNLIQIVQKCAANKPSILGNG